MKFLFAVCILALSGCSSPPGLYDSSYGASIGIVNHTDRYIDSASINGAGGGNMGAWGAGLANVCCISVPKKWNAGMKAQVRWDVPERSQHSYKEKTVDIERFDEGGSIYIHFFPGDEVRVVISKYAGWSPQHPIPAPKAPPTKNSQVQ